MPTSFDKRLATKEVHTWPPINVHRDLEIKSFSLRRCFTARMFPLLWIIIPQKRGKPSGIKANCCWNFDGWFPGKSCRNCCVAHWNHNDNLVHVVIPMLAMQIIEAVSAYMQPSWAWICFTNYAARRTYFAWGRLEFLSRTEGNKVRNVFRICK